MLYLCNRLRFCFRFWCWSRNRFRRRCKTFQYWLFNTFWFELNIDHFFAFRFFHRFQLFRNQVRENILLFTFTHADHFKVRCFHIGIWHDSNANLLRFFNVID
ncbi:Uncharacterised protein [Vibrio cholerae]|uniref:Uncharacterized protein n=1 Tax=Vibrio cholerae TaxID=666 RepID=A0A656AK18_VIBCL|nr:Uncharacterised protein [Vibrio cholerae]CSC48485.1 Uncharacterised protein [Vibrio cholerae]CSD12917.1 Uncharacterised protein [Vibrio cholerae]